MSERPEWKSKTGFLLAALGSAIGLGNIWRFPYIAYRNGGGAFLIPYFVALFVVGVPLLILEFGMGHATRRAFPQALGAIHPRFKWIGWWAVSFVMFGIVAYYGVVIAWCGNYLIYSITQPWGDLSSVNSFFDETFLGAFSGGEAFSVYDAETGFHLGSTRWQVVVALAVVWFVNWLITRRQLQHGVELASKIFIPALVLITIVLVVWSWNFEGAAAGRRIYLRPDWSRVFQPQTWIDAFTQIFFTLSLGFGIMVAYGSYLPKRADIPTSACLAAVGNCAYSILAGFAVFAAVGLLAHDQQIDLDNVQATAAELRTLQESEGVLPDASHERLQQLQAENARNTEFQTQMSSFGLLFKTYPGIITRMGGTTGRVFGVLFFLSLLVAGISSAISIIEAFVSALSDEFGWRRQTMVTGLCITGFLLGLVFCHQSGLFWLDLVDHFITTYGLVLVAICECVIVGWLFPIRRLRTHLDEYRTMGFRRTFSFLMRLMISVVLFFTWYGLTQVDVAVFGSLGRFLLLGCAIILWIDEHWLDFNIRLVIPGLLIFLLDQALVAELQSSYGNYPGAAVLAIGLGWLVVTLVIGVGLSLIGSDASGSRGNQGNDPA